MNKYRLVSNLNPSLRFKTDKKLNLTIKINYNSSKRWLIQPIVNHSTFTSKFQFTPSLSSINHNHLNKNSLGSFKKYFDHSQLAVRQETRFITNKVEELKVETKTKVDEVLEKNKIIWYQPYWELARMDKPIGTMLLLWPCVWSIGMASYHYGTPLSTTLAILGTFTAGAFIMRGAGCTINDLWDIKYDKKVARTLTRPLASGAVTPAQGLGFLALQLSGGLAVLLQLNWYSIVLGASSLGLVVIYPLMKRITYWPQLVLGMAFNWGALLGWSAIAGDSNWLVTLPLYGAGICWTIVYDTIYAHQDKVDDVKIGVKSTALFMGTNTKTYLTGFSLFTIGLLLTSGYLNAQGLPYFLGVSVLGSSHLFWQLKTVNLDDPAQCWSKFRANTQFGAIIAASIGLDYLCLTYC